MWTAEVARPTYGHRQQQDRRPEPEGRPEVTLAPPSPAGNLDAAEDEREDGDQDVGTDDAPTRPQPTHMSKVTAISLDCCGDAALSRWVRLSGTALHTLTRGGF